MMSWKAIRDIVCYGDILSPFAYLAFGRHRVSRGDFLKTYNNTNTATAIIWEAHERMVLAALLLPDPNCEPRIITERMIAEIEEHERAIEQDRSSTRYFWYAYEGILSRHSLTSEQINYGLSKIAFWMDLMARKDEALSVSRRASEIDEMGQRYRECERLLNQYH